MTTRGIRYSKKNKLKVKLFVKISAGHFSWHCSPSSCKILAYGETAIIGISQVAEIIQNAVFTCILGFNGVTIALCLSWLKHKRVRTEVPIKIVWIGYTTWHIKRPRGNFPINSSVTSNGILNTLVPRSVSAKFKMKYSFGLRFACRYTAKQTSPFPSEPTTMTAIYRVSCIAPVIPLVEDSFVMLSTMAKAIPTTKGIWGKLGHCTDNPGENTELSLISYISVQL